MVVYRIVKSIKRANDLSGTGAFLEGGRWNSPGVYALYTSENRSLASLEVLVHVDESELPPGLFIIGMEIGKDATLYEMKEDELPPGWREPENIALRTLGDRFFAEQKYLGIKVPSAVMPQEYNYVLNPVYPRFRELVRVVSVTEFVVDQRLKPR